MVYSKFANIIISKNLVLTNIQKLHLFSLTHISLVSFLWDIGKQYSPKCDTAERGIPSRACLHRGISSK